jgi:hypothetical protein
MEPAYHIPLTEAELRLIGETCAIQGQIEFLMQNAVMHLLDAEFHTALTIMGSTSIHTNAEVWLAVIRDKCDDSELVALAQQIKNDLGAAAKGRNDFVHALFAIATADGLSIKLNRTKPSTDAEGGTPVAVRTKTRNQRPASDIQAVRDRAANISRAMAHLNHCLFRGKAALSPWRDK